MSINRFNLIHQKRQKTTFCVAVSVAHLGCFHSLLLDQILSNPLFLLAFPVEVGSPTTNHLKGVQVNSPSEPGHVFGRSAREVFDVEPGIHSVNRFKGDFWVCNFICIWMFPKIVVPPNHPF